MKKPSMKLYLLFNIIFVLSFAHSHAPPHARAPSQARSHAPAQARKHASTQARNHIRSHARLKKHLRTDSAAVKKLVIDPAAPAPNKLSKDISVESSNRDYDAYNLGEEHAEAISAEAISKDYDANNLKAEKEEYVTAEPANIDYGAYNLKEEDIPEEPENIEYDDHKKLNLQSQKGSNFGEEEADDKEAESDIFQQTDKEGEEIQSGEKDPDDKETQSDKDINFDEEIHPDEEDCDDKQTDDHSQDDHDQDDHSHDNDDENDHKIPDELYEQEIKQGHISDLFVANSHHHYPQTYGYDDLGRRRSMAPRRFVPIYPYYEKDPPKEKQREIDLALIPVKASPEFVLAIAKQSALLEASRPSNPTEKLIEKHILRGGNYWNQIWKEDYNPAVLRTSETRKPLEAIKAKVAQDSELFELVSTLKRVSPQLLYVINGNDKNDDEN